MLNKFIFVGRITADPELKYSNGGTSYTAFSVAVPRPRREGKEEETDFFNCIAWGKRAEVIAQYCYKGQLVTIESELRNDRYTDSKGITHYNDKAFVNSIVFSGKKKEEQNPRPNEQSDEQLNSIPTDEELAEFFNDDGIPF